MFRPVECSAEELHTLPSHVDSWKARINRHSRKKKKKEKKKKKGKKNDENLPQIVNVNSTPFYRLFVSSIEEIQSLDDWRQTKDRDHPLSRPVA